MKYLVLSFLAILFINLTSSAYAQSESYGEKLFYYVDTESAFKSLEDHIAEISVIAPQSYKVDAQGVVWGEVDPRVIKIAESHDVKVMPLITNLNFDQTLLHQLLSDSAAVHRMIGTLVDLCTRNKYIGIQFDFENLNMNDKDIYTRMCREAADALHKKGFQLSLAVVHRTQRYPGNTAYLAWLFQNWRGGYDLKRLGDIVDFISIMTYSEHTGRTTPGPVAAYGWVKKVVEYCLKYIPPGKLSLGIPLYSEHWYTAYDSSPSTVSGSFAHSASSALGYEDVEGLIERYNANVIWDKKDKINYAILDNDGVFEYLYIEDAKSFAAKATLIQKYHLRGFSAWVLGEEDPGIWKMLK